MRAAGPGDTAPNSLGAPTGSFGLTGFFGVSYAVSAEGGVFFGGTGDVGLYLTVGFGGGWGSSSGVTGGVLQPGYGITDPNIQLGAAVGAVSGALSQYNHDVVGGSGGTGSTLGLGFYGVGTRTFTLSLRDVAGFAHNVITGIRNGC